jgi:hypothetical protein
MVWTLPAKEAALFTVELAYVIVPALKVVTMIPAVAPVPNPKALR